MVGVAYGSFHLAVGGMCEASGEMRLEQAVCIGCQSGCELALLGPHHRGRVGPRRHTHLIAQHGLYLTTFGGGSVIGWLPDQRSAAVLSQGCMPPALPAQTAVGSNQSNVLWAKRPPR